MGHERRQSAESTSVTTLAARALNNTAYLWLLRQTIAHEIAHETAGHANQKVLGWFTGGNFSLGASGQNVGLPWYVRLYNYPTEKELEADRVGLEYWKRLGWDCQIWVRILENFQNQQYQGDIYHPTDRRLQQARDVCDLTETKNPEQMRQSPIPKRFCTDHHEILTSDSHLKGLPLLDSSAFVQNSISSCFSFSLLRLS